MKDPNNDKIIGWFVEMDRLYAGFRAAAAEIKTLTGIAPCVPGCGACCHVSVMAHGIEAEYARTILIGSPDLTYPALDAAREWLTRPGDYTYGAAITEGNQDRIAAELERVQRETCCFLDKDNSCILHEARPIACRAYGVTHLPNTWCKRPPGLGETEFARTINRYDVTIPIRQIRRELMASLDLVRFQRQGFFAAMLFEAMAAKEFAGLLDDGKIPLVKVVNIPPGEEDMMCVWQEQAEAVWRAEAADASIATQPHLEDRGGVPVVILD